MKIFSKTAENTGRQHEIDYLRGFTALIIVICHVGLYLGNGAGNGFYVFSDLIGSEWAAPILMTLMGISIVYSRHNKPKDLLKRGIYLFLLGYILSIFRSIVPYIVFGKIDEWTAVDAFFVVDILQFAGLTFMFLALLKKLKLPNLAIFIISLAMVVADQFIMLPEVIPWNSEILTGIVNLFCPVSSWSCFPFLTWFAFPAFGLCFGDLLKHVKNKNIFYLILLLIGLAGVIYVYSEFYILYPNYTFYYFGNNFYYMGIKNVVLTFTFVIFALSIWYFLEKILPKFIKQSLTFLSVNLNVFYIISWIIISFLIHLQAKFNWNFGLWLTIIMIVVINIHSAGTTLLFNNLKDSIKKKKTIKEKIN